MSNSNSSQTDKIINLPWANKEYSKKWASKSSQSVNSQEYKQLRQYIHMPYRKIDNQGMKCYYFPTYVIFKVKNITDFDFESLAASINGVLIISIMVDYKDKFSPTFDLDQDQVREAIEDIFVDFRFDREKPKENEGKYRDIAPGKKADEIEKKEKNQEDKKKQENKKKQEDKKKQENKKKPGENDKQVSSDDQDESIPSFKKDYLYVQFNRDNPLRLPTKRIFEGQISQSTEITEGKVAIKWTIRKEFRISLVAGTIWEDLIAPFNLLNFRLSLSFEDIDVQLPAASEDTKPQMVKFKFNCMKRVGNDSSEEKKRIFQQLNFTDDGSLGEYDLAETSLSIKCEKFQSEETGGDNIDPYRSFKVVTFNIPFYKYPIMDSLTIFIPLVLITILTLFTFAQGPDYNDKIGNIATLMIVYVGLVPVINDSLPPTTSITLIDMVIYSQLVINLLCLIRGYLIMNYDTEQFDAYSLWQDPFFIVSVIISIISGIVLILLLIYYCVMKSCFYNLEEADVDESQRNIHHWVSPHMYNEARNTKTQIEKVKQDRKKCKSVVQEEFASEKKMNQH